MGNYKYVKIKTQSLMNGTKKKQITKEIRALWDELKQKYYILKPLGYT